MRVYLLLEHITCWCHSKWQSHVSVPTKWTRNVVKYDDCPSKFRLWYPEPASMSVRYLTPASLCRISLNLGLLWIGLTSALLSLAGSRHHCNLPLALGTSTKLLQYSHISSTPSGTIICCFCSWSCSSLSSSCSAYATLLGSAWHGWLPYFTCNLYVPSNTWFLEKTSLYSLWILCINTQFALLCAPLSMLDLK